MRERRRLRRHRRHVVQSRAEQNSGAMMQSTFAAAAAAVYSACRSIHLSRHTLFTNYSTYTAYISMYVYAARVARIQSDESARATQNSSATCGRAHGAVTTTSTTACACMCSALCASTHTLIECDAWGARTAALAVIIYHRIRTAAQLLHPVK